MLCSSRIAFVNSVLKSYSYIQSDKNHNKELKIELFCFLYGIFTLNSFSFDYFFNFVCGTPS